MAGVTPQGFQPKTFTEMIEDIRNDYQSTESFGPNFSFENGDPQYHIVTAIINELVTAWDTLEDVYNSRGIETSSRNSLDANVKYAGIRRRQAIKATATLGQQFNGIDGTIVPINFMVQSGDVIYRTTQSGTISSGSVNLTIEALIGGSAGNKSIGAIDFITEPLVGLTSTTNTVATTGGLNSETDEELKRRYLASLAKGGGSTTNAIRATILQVSGVTDAVVRNNETLVTDAGVPAKSVAPVILGGSASDVQDAIYSVKSGGIQCFGTDTKDFVDDSNNTITIGISRPTQVDVWVNATVTSNSDYPADGNDQVETAIIDHINSLEIGNDVILFNLILSIGNAVAGITNIVLETSTDGITFLPADVTIADLSNAVTDAAKVVVS